jgi:lysophospholipase L1-like esterase
MRNLRPIKLLALILLALIGAAEIGVRLSGILDFPTYLVDPEIGYLLKPNQSGKFLNKNPWVFNDRSMPIGANWNPRAHPDLLLIGNSVIMGGNPYAQQDKVGPLVQRELGDSVAVWPTAVGGWTQVNETAYLQRNPDIVGANAFFVWEVMNGGFSRLAPWAGDYVFPRQRPLCGSCYVLRRYLLPRILSLHESELPPVGQSDPQQVANFEAMIARLCASSPAAVHGVHGVLLLYPTQPELAQARRGVEWLPDRSEFERIAASHGLRVIDLAAQPDWDDSKYRNDHTHPSVQGNQVLAHVIGAAIQSYFRPNP